MLISKLNCNIIVSWFDRLVLHLTGSISVVFAVDLCLCWAINGQGQAALTSISDINSEHLFVFSKTSFKSWRSKQAKLRRMNTAKILKGKIFLKTNGTSLVSIPSQMQTTLGGLLFKGKNLPSESIFFPLNSSPFKTWSSPLKVLVHWFFAMEHNDKDHKRTIISELTRH